MAKERSGLETIYRSLDLQELVDVAMQALEADLNGSGFSTAEIHDAIRVPDLGGSPDIFRLTSLDMRATLPRA